MSLVQSSGLAFALLAGLSVAQASPLDLAKRSAELVLEKDRATWLDLYGPRSTVEDPVGTQVHRKEAKRLNLATFWDVFIAPNEIVFESHLDLDRPEIAIRDVTIHTKSPSGLLLDVPAFVVYRPHEEDPARVGSMRAFWEIRDQFQKAKEAGPLGKETSQAMLKRIFHFEGLPGILGFAKGFLAPTQRRRRAIQEWFGDGLSAQGSESPRLALNGVELTDRELESWSAFRLGKLLVAGPEAIARVQIGSGAGATRDGFVHVVFGAGRELRAIDFYF